MENGTILKSAAICKVTNKGTVLNASGFLYRQIHVKSEVELYNTPTTKLAHYITL